MKNKISILTLIFIIALLSSCKDNGSNENTKPEVEEGEKIEQKLESQFGDYTEKIEQKLESQFGDYMTLSTTDRKTGKYIVYEPASDGFLIVSNSNTYSTYTVGIAKKIGVNPILWGKTNNCCTSFTFNNYTNESTSADGTIPVKKGHRFVVHGDKYGVVTWIGIGAKANEVLRQGAVSYAELSRR